MRMRHVLTPSLGASGCTETWRKLGPIRCCSCVSVRALRLNIFCFWDPEVLPVFSFSTRARGGGKKGQEAWAGPAPEHSFAWRFHNHPPSYGAPLNLRSVRFCLRLCSCSPSCSSQSHATLPTCPSSTNLCFTPISPTSHRGGCGPFHLLLPQVCVSHHLLCKLLSLSL